MRLEKGDTLPNGQIVVNASNKQALVVDSKGVDVWEETSYKEHDQIAINLTSAICLDCNIEYQITDVGKIDFPYIRLLMHFPDNCDDDQKI
jgi:hypothetical protein